MRLLIVNADDFGLNDSATDGIAECFLKGSVTSTTIMANAPAYERAVQFAVDNPKLGVGLHFNLTWGRPVSRPEDVPALVNKDGRFFSRNELVKRLWLRRIPKSQIDIEIRAQKARLVDSGIQPTHIDSHQHVHAFRKIFSAVAESCSSSNIPVRVPWVVDEKGATISRWARRRVLTTLLDRSTREWRGKVAWNDGLGSIFDVQRMELPLSDNHYRQILSSADGDSFELMVHPVTDAAAMDGFTGIGEISEEEWRYLRTGRLGRLAETEGFALGTYRDLAA